MQRELISSCLYNAKKAFARVSKYIYPYYTIFENIAIILSIYFLKTNLNTFAKGYGIKSLFFIALTMNSYLVSAFSINIIRNASSNFMDNLKYFIRVTYSVYLAAIGVFLVFTVIFKLTAIKSFALVLTVVPSYIFYGFLVFNDTRIKALLFMISIFSILLLKHKSTIALILLLSSVITFVIFLYKKYLIEIQKKSSIDKSIFNDINKNQGKEKKEIKIYNNAIIRNFQKVYLIFSAESILLTLIQKYSVKIILFFHFLCYAKLGNSLLYADQNQTMSSLAILSSVFIQYPLLVYKNRYNGVSNIHSMISIILIAVTLFFYNIYYKELNILILFIVFLGRVLLALSKFTCLNYSVTKGMFIYQLVFLCVAVAYMSFFIAFGSEVMTYNFTWLAIGTTVFTITAIYTKLKGKPVYLQ